jgi:hypothetical protein
MGLLLWLPLLSCLVLHFLINHHITIHQISVTLMEGNPVIRPSLYLGCPSIGKLNLVTMRVLLPSPPEGLQTVQKPLFWLKLDFRLHHS